MAKHAATSFLQIHLPERWPDPAAAMALPVRWALQDGPRFDDGVSRLDDVPRADEVVAVLPVARVLFTSANLPRGPASKLARVVPFAIEECDRAVSGGRPRGRAGRNARGRRAAGRGARPAMARERGRGARVNWSFAQSKQSSKAPSSRTNLTFGLSSGPANGGFAALGSIEAIALDAADDARPPLALKLIADERRARGAGPREVRVLLAGGAEPPDAARWSESLHAPVTLCGRWLPEEIDARLAECPNLLPGVGANVWSGSEWRHAPEARAHPRRGNCRRTCFPYRR